MLHFLLFVGLNTLVFVGFQFWLARRGWPLLDTLVGAFLLLLGQVFCVEMLLAGVGQLGLWQAVGVHLALSAGVWGWTGRATPKIAGRTRRELRALCGAMTGYSWVALALMAFVLAWVVVVAFFAPSFNWDANMYHIPIAALRLQEGNLERLHSSWAWIEGYPESGEMFIVWQLLFLRSQMLADAVQLPFWLFGVLAIVSLSLKMGAKVPYAFMGGSVWMLAPVAVLQARNAGNDLMVASLFWMGMNLAYQRPASPLVVSLTGIAAGLLAGIKLGAGWLVIVLGVFTVWSIVRSPNRRALVVVFLAVWVGFGLLNAYWYFSNWWHTGNPIWPIGGSLDPLVHQGRFWLAKYEERYTPSLLQGKPLWQQLWLVWLETESHYHEAAKLTGFGPLWIAVGVPSIAAWVILERKSWPLVLASLLVLVLQPLAWHTRYVLFLPGLGGIALAAVLSRFRAVARVTAKLMLMGGAVFSFLMVFEAHKLCYLWMPQAYRAPVYGNTSIFAGAYRWLDANTRAPARVAYGGPVAFPAPLWGEDLRHSVAYIRPSDLELWERAVLDRGTEWVFAVIGSVEEETLKGSSRFALVVDDRRVDYPATLRTRIYRAVGERAGE